MLKRKLAALVLGATSLMMVASPAMADDHWYRDRRMSEHQRHEYEKQLKKQQRAERKAWEKAERNRLRNESRRYNSYGNNGPTYRNGYYDQYGVFHPYRR